jgi:hypothetical protein
MKAKNIFSPIYRQDYFEGYELGLNPHKSSINIDKSEAFYSGFDSGRLDYESRNGSICNGIPKTIVTNKVLEEFLLAGLLGLSIGTEGYTLFQLNVIEKWYQSGVEKYDPNQTNYLISILDKEGIEIR